jgi:hypothetical protein
MRGRAPILPQRQRHIPPHFSWIDHRLVRDGHVRGRSTAALALYLFLVTVSDAEGLSWYSDGGLCQQLAWSEAQLQQARAELQQVGLIAYRQPLVQVLDLASAPAPTPSRSRHAGGEAAAVGDILKRLMGGAQ